MKPNFAARFIVAAEITRLGWVDGAAPRRGNAEVNAAWDELRAEPSLDPHVPDQQAFEHEQAEASLE